ncbi:GH15 family glucan-1,4-alpha-glucosidase [Spinactinospora alkalitolerans]|uniref:GH15 family glucan-1,4-alpha-glucosidase n=1 Tax=Spinactinospora alkalitolerans TaxID=687207 RepID=A0A852TXM6_9ACTN|nr:glycoside hydrolase family 15 protein [Spinactinospora alkalitolerans]NYE47692.1 GH15 family glucan-1,4-alpha-glucosidase [Spinactinospora alkalitolerans]
MNGNGCPPIGEYVFLSDCHTCALVGPDGAVDWMCAPQFDSPSVFGRLLDRGGGGAWELSVADAGAPERDYAGAGLVLRSRWRTPSATVLAHDFLAVRPRGAGPDGELASRGFLVRLVRCEEGRARVLSRLRARPDHGRRAPRWRGGEGVLHTEHGGLWLSGDPGLLSVDGEGDVGVDADLRAGDTLALVMGYRGGTGERMAVEDAERLLRETLRTWQDWTDRSDYQGVGAEQVERSAVVLRGLLFEETGALIAAPTTSLPEWPGGERNWDYRHVWHRDAVLVVLALLRLGHKEEVGRYLAFLNRHCAQAEGPVPPMMALDGGVEVREETLEHLPGYAGSRPVRSGNGANAQEQLDVYGHILGAACAYHQVTGELGDDDIALMWRVADTVCKRWRDPDHGIWEVRGRPRHWTHSKLLAWFCLDRGIALAEFRGDTGEVPVDTWRRERDALRRDILERGYNEEVGAFTQSYGSTNLDAALLQVPLLGFLDGDDPRVLSTLDRIDAELGEAGFLVRRYDPVATDDGLDSPEGAFLLCSFAMVSALVLAGRVEQARERFEALCRSAGRLGLFAEEMTADGTMLGNYPQAFTHLALIEAAMNLEETGRRDALHGWAGRHAGAGGGG